MMGITFGALVVMSTSLADESVFLPQPEPTATVRPKLPPLPEEDGKLHEILVSAGLHQTASPLPAFGAFYRYSFHRRFSVRGGFEAGQAPISNGGTATSTNLGKASLALLTNEFLYVGLGISYATTGPQSTFAYGGSADAIGGIRLLFPSTLIGGEFRWGIGGPSGVQFYSGYRF